MTQSEIVNRHPRLRSLPIQMKSLDRIEGSRRETACAPTTVYVTLLTGLKHDRFKHPDSTKPGTDH